MLRTGVEEFPRSSRRSQYDDLLNAVDQDVVALIRGEDFDEQIWHDSVRSELVNWGRARGVRVATRAAWNHPQTDEPTPFEREGKPLPYGVYVKVTSLNGDEAYAQRGDKDAKGP